MGKFKIGDKVKLTDITSEKYSPWLYDSSAFRNGGVITEIDLDDYKPYWVKAGETADHETWESDLENFDEEDLELIESPVVFDPWLDIKARIENILVTNLDVSTVKVRKISDEIVKYLFTEIVKETE
jgi:hypothetical protein